MVWRQFSQATGFSDAKADSVVEDCPVRANNTCLKTTCASVFTISVLQFIYFFYCLVSLFFNRGATKACFNEVKRIDVPMMYLGV